MLSRFKVTIDLIDNRLFLQPRSDVEFCGTFDRSGCKFVWLNESIEIVVIEEGSPAEAAGIRVGDRIVALGERKIEPSQISWLRSQLMASAKAPDRSVTLTVERDGQQLVKTLELVDYTRWPNRKSVARAPSPTSRDSPMLLPLSPCRLGL